LPGMPSLSRSAASTCAGTAITFTASGGSGSYDWGGYFSGNGSTKTTPTSAGAYTAQVRSVQTSNGITCYSAYTSSVTGTITAPGSNGQAATCGCATGTINCSGTCRTNTNYTTNDGNCTGSCNYAYVQQRNACGTVINATYSTYYTTACVVADYTTNDGACTGQCNRAYVQLRNGCTGAVKNAQYSTYTNTSCTAGCCTPGGNGQPATSCGCASGLTNCSGTCRTSCTAVNGLGTDLCNVGWCTFNSGGICYCRASIAACPTYPTYMTDAVWSAYGACHCGGNGYKYYYIDKWYDVADGVTYWDIICSN
jgi:hypothetical protein